MNFEFSPKVQDLQARLTAFMEEHVYPAEAVYHAEVEANRAKGNAWVIETPSPCGAASAGIPPQVLELGCPA